MLIRSVKISVVLKNEEASTFICSGPLAFKSQRNCKIGSLVKNYWATICYHQAKTLLNLSIHSREKADFTDPWPRRTHPFFIILAHPKNIKVTFSFLEFVSVCKNQFTPSICSSNTADYKVSWLESSHPCLTIFFNQIKNFMMNFDKLAKILAILSLCSRDIVDLKIQQSDWLGEFWLFQKPIFF